MSKVYIVATNDYSNASAVAAFSDESTANAVADRMNWFVEEFEVDALDPSKWPPGRPFAISVYLNKNGFSYATANELDDPGDFPPPEGTEWKGHAFDGHTRLDSSVWAINHDAAKAVAEAKRAEVAPQQSYVGRESRRR